MTALRILVGLARAVRRQIGERRLGGCNRRPLEKITAFKFCLFGAAPSREGSFFKNTSSTIVLRLTKSTKHTNFSYFVISGFKLILFVLDWVVSTLSFKLTDIIILC